MWLAIAALTLLGFVLRVLAARGALWLDEAWSATFAQEAATPIGVIWRVNHDNNHILNTLWLQLVGPDASPLTQRALAIVTGATAIPLAASIGARRGAATALIAALASPLADPMRLAVAAQQTRLEAGEIAPARFDFDWLQQRGLRFGHGALSELATRQDAPAIQQGALAALARPVPSVLMR